MVLTGFDTDGDGENNFYSVNGPAFYYAKYPIKRAPLADGADLPREPDGVRSRSTRSTCTASSSATTRPVRPITSSTRTP